MIIYFFKKILSKNAVSAMATTIALDRPQSLSDSYLKNSTAKQDRIPEQPSYPLWKSVQLGQTVLGPKCLEP